MSLLLLFSKYRFYSSQSCITSNIMKISLVLLGLAASANAVELTLENFDEHTAGKTVFIKFQAPW